MTRTDDNHRVAAIIKGLEARIADLEEKDRETGTPNLLRSHTDRVVVDDSSIVVTEITLATAKWNDSVTGGFGSTTDSGWNTSTWGALGMDSGVDTQLIVDGGDTYTIPTGSVESYTAASIDGTLTVDGTLETE